MRPSALKRTAYATAALLALTLAPPVMAAGSPTGIWLDDTGRGAIEISTCGKALCGKVVWVKSASDRSGCGESILGGVRAMGGGRWDGGWIYSPDHGRKFDVELTPVGTDKLRVLGYAGIKMFGETRTWKRAPADLKRCDGQEIANTAPPAATEPPKPAPSATGSPPNHEPAPMVDVSPKAEASAAQSTAKTSAEPASDTASNTASPAATATETDTNAEPPPRKRSNTAGGLSIDKVLQKSADGRCKLDLPWAKVTFDCKEL